jgi:hypothetical protein
MSLGSCCSTCFCVILFIGSILFVVMSGVGYAYFSSPWFFVNSHVNLKVLFGCGIGVGIIIFIAIWFYLFQTTECWCCHAIFTVPVIVVMCSLYLAYTVSSATDDMLDVMGENWAGSDAQEAVTAIQWQYHCCGWNNASDHGLAVCPDEFESGCRVPADEYLRPRFKEILISTSIEFSTLILSMIVLTLCMKMEGETEAASLVLLLRGF